MSITKKDICSKICSNFGYNRTQVLNIFDEITKEILETVLFTGKVEIRGFGVFRKVESKKKVGYNFQTKAKMKVYPKTTVRFKLSKTVNTNLF